VEFISSCALPSLALPWSREASTGPTAGQDTGLAPGPPEATKGNTSTVPAGGLRSTTTFALCAQFRRTSCRNGGATLHKAHRCTAPSSGKPVFPVPPTHGRSYGPAQFVTRLRRAIYCTLTAVWEGSSVTSERQAGLLPTLVPSTRPITGTCGHVRDGP